MFFISSSYKFIGLGKKTHTFNLHCIIRCFNINNITFNISLFIKNIFNQTFCSFISSVNTQTSCVQIITNFMNNIIILT